MLARDYMTKGVLTIHPEDLLIDVRKAMQEHGLRHIPVVENDKLVGIVSLNTIRDAVPSNGSFHP